MTDRQGVHGINDNGLKPTSRAPAQHVIHDGHDVGEALAGPRTACQHVGFVFLRLANRLGLVGVQRQFLPRVVGIGLVDSKDSAAFRMERTLLDKVIDCPARRKRGVELKQRLGPQHPIAEGLLNMIGDPGIGDLDETSRVLRVIVNQPVAEIKDVHLANPRHEAK